METPGQRSARLVSALEDLVSQESAALARQDWARVLELQDRTAPLIEFLTANPQAARIDASLRTRIGELHRRRNENSVALAREMGRTRDGLRDAQTAMRRISQFAPVYGSAPATSQRLQAVG